MAICDSVGFYFIFLLSSFTAMQSPNSFPLGEHHTFKLNWKGLSVNYRLRFFFITHFIVPLLPLNLLSSSFPEHLSSETNSPTTSCYVTVATLAQAIAVSLPQTHWFRGVITAQQDLQSGNAGESTVQTNHTLIIIIIRTFWCLHT